MVEESKVPRTMRRSIPEVARLRAIHEGREEP